jgi:N6-adenosine-specific RNA methylase IME4
MIAVSKIAILGKYKNAVFKSTPEEIESLRESVKKDGIREPLTLNPQLVLLDGHQRYELTFEFGITEVPFKIKEFSSELEEYRYVIEANFFRRHLTTWQKARLALKLEEIESKLAKARQKTGKTLAQDRAKGKATEIVAKKAGVGKSTKEQAKKIMKNADEETIAKLDSGRGSTNSEYNKIMIKEMQKLPRLPIPEGKVNYIFYDPAWPFGNLVSGGSGKSGQAQKYRSETIEEMKTNDVWKRADKDAILALCALPTHHMEAAEVIAASGFEPLTKIYWDKMEIKQGLNFRNSVEEIIICTKGKVRAFHMQVPNIIHEKPKERIHSRKPDKLFEILEKAAKRGLPGRKLVRIEVNATKTRPGWITVGNQIAKTADDSEEFETSTVVACSKCLKPFDNPAALKAHKKICPKNNKVKCYKCGKQVKKDESWNYKKGPMCPSCHKKLKHSPDFGSQKE